MLLSRLNAVKHLRPPPPPGSVQCAAFDVGMALGALNVPQQPNERDCGAYVLAYVYTDFLQFVGPVQTALRESFGWHKGDYWFPEVRTLLGRDDEDARYRKDMEDELLARFEDGAA